MDPCRMWTSLSLCCILFLQEGTAMPDNPKQETIDPLLTPGVVFYTYPTLASPGIPLTEDLQGLVPSHPITLVMHGFRGYRTARSMLAIKQAFLLSNVQNLLVVDWSSLSHAPNMSTLTAYYYVRDHGLPTAANLVARWLQRVMTLKDITPDQVHLVGFSQGAHMAGVISRLLNSEVGRITALDPPMFGYVLVPVLQRLDLTAAKFVNVIHTSGAVLGYPIPIGHVDFFPNGDALPQPGCPAESPSHIITCSHYRSFMLFSESVLNEHSLMATECISWLAFTTGLCNNNVKVTMGNFTPNTIWPTEEVFMFQQCRRPSENGVVWGTRGTFFMKTNDEAPFGAEDSDHPLTEEMKLLLTYGKTDKDLLDPSDLFSSSSYPQVFGIVVYLLAVLNLRYIIVPQPFLL